MRMVSPYTTKRIALLPLKYNETSCTATVLTASLKKIKWACLVRYQYILNYIC